MEAEQENTNIPTVGAVVKLEVDAEICCDRCYEVMYNYIDCPVCKSDCAEIDQREQLRDEKEITCEECGTTFEKISDSWYDDCEAKIVSLGRNCHSINK